MLGEQVARPQRQPEGDKVWVVGVLQPRGHVLSVDGVQLCGGVGGVVATRLLPRGRVACAQELVLESSEDEDGGKKGGEEGDGEAVEEVGQDEEWAAVDALASFLVVTGAVDGD